MKKIALVAIAAILLATAAFAQSDADYQGYMKAIAGANGSLGKNIEAKNAAGAAADAQKLADTFKQVEAFWQGRGTADAVAFAQKAGAAANATATAAKAGNMDDTAAAAKTILPNCGGCHMAHRDKTDAGFKIK
jgi:cytochrome c556